MISSVFEGHKTTRSFSTYAMPNFTMLLNAYLEYSSTNLDSLWWLPSTLLQIKPCSFLLLEHCTILFIHIHDPVTDDAYHVEADFHSHQSGSSHSGPQESQIAPLEELGSDITPEERQCSIAFWDAIANQMWQDYQVELQHRGEL